MIAITPTQIATATQIRIGGSVIITTQVDGSRLADYSVEFLDSEDNLLETRSCTCPLSLDEAALLNAALTHFNLTAA